jgi:hypothetical protein
MPMRTNRIVTTALAGAALAAGLALAPGSALAGHKNHRGYGHHPSHHDDHGWRNDDERDDDHGRWRSDDRRHDDEYYDDYRGRHGRSYHRHESFRVPERIVYADVSHYRPYHARRVYHAAHRHYHEVYAFPVQTHHGLVYRHVPYCRGSEGFVMFEGPHVSLRIGF